MPSQYVRVNLTLPLDLFDFAKDQKVGLSETLRTALATLKVNYLALEQLKEAEIKIEKLREMHQKALEFLTRKGLIDDYLNIRPE